MADSETRLDVKIFVHKVKSRVLFAEADGDFIDILFSFLTLPLGTVVRLIGKSRSAPSTLGSLSMLYQSVMSLDGKYFRDEELKDMLLHPRSSCDSHFQGLKINIDDTKANVFLCRINPHYRCCPQFMSIYKNTTCPSCGDNSMRRVIPLKYISKGHGTVSNTATFIITDDLEVKPVVPGTVVGLINSLGISDMSVIEERTVKLGVNELLELLKWTFLSTTPLTDLFLPKNKLQGGNEHKKQPLQRKSSNFAEHSAKVWSTSLKGVLKKSNKEFLYLVAGKDFIDFLLSFLVIPLAEMLHIMEGQSCVGSLDALYKSVLSLDSKYFVSEAQKNILLRPKLPPPVFGQNHLLPLEFTPVECSIGGAMSMMILRSKVGGVSCSDGFLREKTAFFVSDDLEVTPISAAFSILNKNKVSVSDLEERTLYLGMAQGINLLRASLNSTSAISNSLLPDNFIFKEPKQEN